MMRLEHQLIMVMNLLLDHIPTKLCVCVLISWKVLFQGFSNRVIYNFLKINPMIIMVINLPLDNNLIE